MKQHQAPPPIRQARAAVGMSQAELAAAAGITRQAMNAIELGRYVPNTTVAIRIARRLGRRVEDLFAAPDATTVVPVADAPPHVRHGDRVLVGRVGDRLVAHPRTARASFSEGFTPSDAVWLQDGNAEIFSDPKDVDGTAFIVGCDPSLGLLASMVTRRLDVGRLAWIAGSSEHAIRTVSRSRAHAAGVHLRDPRTKQCNVAAGRAARQGGVLIGYTKWEQGFVVRKGNPKRIGAPESLARRDVRIINREHGSGSRSLLDQFISEGGLRADAIDGYATEAHSHFAVARAVAAGSADAGIGLRAVAEIEGLDFVPLDELSFDLVIPSAHLEHRAIGVMLDVLQEARTRRELATLPGYDASDAGVVRRTFDAAA
jgi:molybdate-binding protein/DNA-binding XRE family transcriptional regulator